MNRATEEAAMSAISHSLPLQRRAFLGTAGVFTLGFCLPGRDAEAAAGQRVNSWLSIAPDNSVTLTIGASDMGQGSVQALGQVLA